MVCFLPECKQTVVFGFISRSSPYLIICSFFMASMLGPDEDFDGLVSELEDAMDMEL